MVQIKHVSWSYATARAIVRGKSGKPGFLRRRRTVDVEEAFLEDIIVHPDEDAPRLIYADWLEEHEIDRERAEFIRVQIALEGETEEGPRRWHLQHRQAELLRANQVAW